MKKIKEDESNNSDGAGDSILCGWLTAFPPRRYSKRSIMEEDGVT